MSRLTSTLRRLGERYGLFVLVFALFALVLALTSCRSSLVTRRHEAVSDSTMSARRDTLRMVSLVRDTLHWRDTVRVRYETRGETTYVWRDRVRYVYRSVSGRDTLWRTRTDTLWRTRTAVTAAETTRTRRPLRLALIGALAVAALAGWLALSRRRS